MISRTRRNVTALLCAVTLVGCGKQEAPKESAPPPPTVGKQGLALSSWKSATPNPQDRLLLAHAIVKGKPEAMVMVATSIGAVPEVAMAMATLGGDVVTRSDDVGYLRVRLPLERLAEVSALPNVLMAHPEGPGRGGSYTRDRDLVSYPVEPAQQVTQAAAVSAPGLQSTDTLLGTGEATIAADIEGLLRAAVDAGSEVLTHSDAGGRFPEAGEDLFALMANRVVEVHGKPMFVAAGDAGTVESINGAASGRRALAIGAYASAESHRAQFGFSTPMEEMVAVWSSRGPASDGGAKPDLLSPTSATDSALSSAAKTSAALIAAARAEQLPVDVRHISWALRMGARRLQNYQAHEQGFGLIDEARSLELLRQRQASGLDLPDIQTRAAVKTYLSRLLPEPGVGQGLYEREGWLVGQKDTRKITLLRQSGADSPLSYSLQWQGNDGTFEVAQKAVVLPLNVAVEVPIEIEPRQVGIHSAHLYLIDEASELPVHAALVTVVASDQFTAANGYTVQYQERELQALRSRSYFLEVPPNVSSLRVDLSVGAGQVQLALVSGGPIDAGFNLPPAQQLATAGRPATVLVAYPHPGVYELAVLPFGSSKEFTRSQYRVPTDVKVAASIRYVDSQLDDEPPKDNATTLWMNNIYAPLQRSDVLAEVGARRVLADVGGPSSMRAYNITVPAGSSSLRVAASPSDGKTKPGIYLYDCAAASCKLWGSDVFTRTVDKAVVVPNPRAGLWKVVVDAGTAGAAFRYTEIMTNPRYGVGKVEGEPEARRIGARWNQKVSYQIAEAAPFGYELVGVMDLMDLGSEADERAAPYGDWQTSGEARDRPQRPLRLTTQVIPLQQPRRPSP